MTEQIIDTSSVADPSKPLEQKISAAIINEILKDAHEKEAGHPQICPTVVIDGCTQAMAYFSAFDQTISTAEVIDLMEDAIRVYVIPYREHFRNNPPPSNFRISERTQ